MLLGAPALALDGTQLAPATSTEVPLVGAATTSGTGLDAEAAVDANLIGITWSGDPDVQFAVDVRSEDGAWASAPVLAASDVGADDGSPDAASAAHRPAEHSTEPVWVGRTDRVRVRVVAGEPGDVTLVAVQSGRTVAPDGSAGALADVLPTGSDGHGFAIALLVVAALLAAVALGWSPWRSRRHAAVLAVVAVVALAACAPPPPPTTESSGGAGVLPPKPTINARASWGAAPFSSSPDCQPGPEIADQLKFAVVHHTAGSNSYTAAQSAGIVQGIQQFHMGTWGYCDIAYNFLIDRYGQIFEGRAGGIDKAVVAAHAGGFNTGSTGVSMMGIYSSVQPPQAQWDALVDLLAWKLSVHKVDPSKGFTTTAGSFSGSRFPAGASVSMPNAIIGHRDVDATECPGDAFAPRLDELRNAVQPRIGWGETPTTTTGPAPTTTAP